MKFFKHLCIWGLFVLTGLILGYVFGTVAPPVVDLTSTTVREVPLPHQISKYPGGLSLRFAMVHDILTERYPRHSDVWYRRRNKNVRENIKNLRPEIEENEEKRKKYFARIDDLGVGLDRIGRSGKAISVLKNKLKLQKKLNIPREKRYTSHANLGTVMIHAFIKDAIQGDKQAREQVRTGLEHITKSIEINPRAHFGREHWQQVIVQYLLKAMEDPEFLLKYDFVGNRLDQNPDPDDQSSLTARTFYLRFVRDRPLEDIRDPGPRHRRQKIRNHIKRLETTQDYRTAVPGNQQKSFPFDEPVLGIIGMWRLGGGPNPHFALALGEIMLRVGQRHLAMEAYERALYMKEKFWPEPEIRNKLIQHCEKRKRQLKKTFSPLEKKDFSRNFRAELQKGKRWQKMYQSFEKQRIENGIPLDQSNFHEPFLEKHGDISTKPGKANWLRVKQRTDIASGNLMYAGILMLLFGGIGSFLGGLYIYKKNP